MALLGNNKLASHNLDTFLGHSGKAAPWLAIAAATQSV